MLVAAAKLLPEMTTSRVWPCLPKVGLTLVMVGAGGNTVKPAARVSVSMGVVTVTSLVPRVASAPTVMLAVISVELVLVNAVTVIPSPKLTSVAPRKEWPVIVTSRLAP